MIIRLNRDVVSGGVFAAVGTAFAATASRYDIGNATEMGSGYFPLCVGILLAALGVFVAVRALRLKEAEGVDVRLRAVLFVIGALVAFALLLPLLGLPIAAFVVFVVAAKADPTTPLKHILITGAVLAVLVYLLFIVALGLPMPAFPRL